MEAPALELGSLVLIFWDSVWYRAGRVVGRRISPEAGQPGCQFSFSLISLLAIIPVALCRDGQLSMTVVCIHQKNKFKLSYHRF